MATEAGDENLLASDANVAVRHLREPNDDVDFDGRANATEHQNINLTSVDGVKLSIQPKLHLLLDAGYGIPREARPRQEKILAIAKQIANFLQWQVGAKGKGDEFAPVTVVGCSDEEMKTALNERLEKLLKSMNHESDNNNYNNITESSRLPSHFSFARDDEHSHALWHDAIYLSPDAPTVLHPSRPPPSTVVVGLLIDRRVQINRSLQRSETLGLETRSWPMEALSSANNYHPQEPLNVDTILEALQQWSWNCSSSGAEVSESDTPFLQASLQAFRHHAQRHPARPKHR